MIKNINSTDTAIIIIKRKYKNDHGIKFGLGVAIINNSNIEVCRK